MIFGQDAIRGATILYEEGAAGIEDWTNKVDDAGYAAETAATKLDNLKGDWEALSGAVDTALISMGEAADGPLRFFVQGLTDLVDKFNAIPDAGQQAVFWIGSAAAAAGLAYGAYLLLIPKVAEFNAALELMSPRTQAVAKGLGMIAKIGGGAIAGLAVGVVALDALTQALKEIGPEAEVVANKVVSARSAVDLLSASAGKFGGSGIELATKQLKELGDVLDRGGASGAGDVIGNSTISNIRLLGDELAKVAGSDLPAAQRQFRLLAEGADLSEKQQGLLLDQMPALKSALTDQATASGVAADGQALLEIAMGESEDAAVDNEDALRALAGQSAITGEEVDGLADQIRNFGSATLNTRDAQRQFEQALDDLQESIDANGTSLDITTQAGRDNQAAIDEIVTSTLEWSASVQEQTGDQAAANSVLADGRQRLIDMLGQFGITGEAAETYADDLGLIPGNIDTFVSVSGVETAQQKIENLRAALSRIPARKTVSIDTITGNPSMNDIPGNADGGAIYGPGGPRDDMVLRRLSPGEHVLDAGDVNAMGGQHAVYAFRNNLHSGGAPTAPVDLEGMSISGTLTINGLPGYVEGVLSKHDRSQTRIARGRNQTI
jgi:hypothetical protein